jgi:mxaJ protein
MQKETITKLMRVIGTAMMLAIAGVSSSAYAEAEQMTLKVCAAAKQAPYSLQDGSGFENRVAQILADQMERKLEFVWSQKPAIYMVRDMLNTGECDLVMGVDTGDERLLTSDPYYRTGYVFVSKQEKAFSGDSWNDPALKNFSRFAMSFGSPAEVMLKQIGMSKYEDNAAYLFSLVNFKSRRNQYTQIPPARLIGEVVQGKADLAIAFAPEVARYVASSPVPLRMTVITNDQQRADGKAVPHHFSQSIGVRKDDLELLADINLALSCAGPKIVALLEQEGIPLLELYPSERHASNLKQLSKSKKCFPKV